MTESKVSVADRELREAEKWFAYVNAFEKSGRLIMEEGLWMGMGIDIFLVTGEVHSQHNPILFAQREGLVGLFSAIDAMSTSNIPILKDINPIGALNSFIAPLGKIVAMTLPDEGTMKKVKPVNELKFPVEWIAPVTLLFDTPDLKIPLGFKAVTVQNYYYPALPIQYRVVLALLVPGILRTIFKFLSSTMKVP